MVIRYSRLENGRNQRQGSNMGGDNTVITKVFTKEDLVEGDLYYNSQISTVRMVKIVKKENNRVKVEVWSDGKGKFVLETMDYIGFYKNISTQHNDDNS